MNVTPKLRPNARRVLAIDIRTCSRGLSFDFELFATVEVGIVNEAGGDA